MSSPLARPASPVHHVPSSQSLRLNQQGGNAAPVDQTVGADDPIVSRCSCRFALQILEQALIFFIDNTFEFLKKPCEFIFFASDYISGLAHDIAVVANRCLFAPEFDPYSPKFIEQLNELTTQAATFEARLHDIEALIPISNVHLMKTLNQLIEYHSALKVCADRIQRFSAGTRRCHDLAELHTNTVTPLLARFQAVRTNFSELIRNDVQRPAVERFEHLIARLWEFGAKIPKSFTSEFRDMLWTLDKAFYTGLFTDPQWESHRKDYILQRINTLETGPDVTASADQNAPPRLRNLGNSCYMNALTQLIFTTPNLAQRLENPLERLPRESDQAYERRENIRKELYYFTQPRGNQPTTVPTLTNLQMLFLISENDKSTVSTFGEPIVSGQSRLPSVAALQRNIFEPKWRYDLRMQRQRMETELTRIDAAINRMNDRRFEDPNSFNEQDYGRLQDSRTAENTRLQNDLEYARIQGLINNGVDYGDFIYENLMHRRQLDSAQILELYMDAVLPYRFEQEVVLRTEMFPGLEFVKRPEVQTIQQLPIQTPLNLDDWVFNTYGQFDRVTQQMRTEYQAYLREAQREMSSLDYQIRSFFQESLMEGEGRDFDPNWTMEEDNIEVRTVGPEGEASRLLNAFSRSENIHLRQTNPELFRYTEHYSLRNLPDVLPLHLKRFETVYGARGPIQRKVDFGITLPEDGYIDLTEYQDSQDRAQPAVYRITAYVEHSGSLNGGHYVAYTERNGRYYYCSDTTVNEVTRQQFINNRNAYTIMLKKVPAEEAADILARRIAATLE
jgi:hypothetical protein